MNNRIVIKPKSNFLFNGVNKKALFLLIVLMFLISNGAQALTVQEILFTPLPTGFTGQGYDSPQGQAPVPPSFGGATGQVLGASTTGLVGYWKMDESSGITAADSSGQSNTATLSGGSFVAGNINNALSLNGSTNYADVGNPAFSVMVPFSLPKLTPVSMSNSVNTNLLWENRS